MSKRIQNIFSEVPETYERVNHVLTMGLDILWRRKAAKMAAMAGGTRWIDVCSGTGEMAALLSRHAKNGIDVYATDFSFPMLGKARGKPEGKDIRVFLSDIKKLPFHDNTFDLITISFATRNINVSREILIKSFQEFYRVLKPEGRFVNLETSQPSFWIFKKLFHLYVKLLVRPLGRAISGSDAGYAYLSSTIPRFYPAEELAGILRLAGFDKIRFQRMMLGAAAIHVSMKGDYF